MNIWIIIDVITLNNQIKLNVTFGLSTF